LIEKRFLFLNHFDRSIDNLPFDRAVKLKKGKKRLGSVNQRRVFHLAIFICGYWTIIIWCDKNPGLSLISMMRFHEQSYRRTAPLIDWWPHATYTCHSTQTCVLESWSTSCSKSNQQTASTVTLGNKNHKHGKKICESDGFAIKFLEQVEQDYTHRTKQNLHFKRHFISFPFLPGTTNSRHFHCITSRYHNINKPKDGLWHWYHKWVIYKPAWNWNARNMNIVQHSQGKSAISSNFNRVFDNVCIKEQYSSFNILFLRRFSIQ
jgi:hypothetical protein